MILLSYLYLIVTTTLLVQTLNSARWNNNNNYQQGIENPAIGYHRIAFPQSKTSVRQFVSNNKNDVFNKAFIMKNNQNGINRNAAKLKTDLERVLQRIGLKLARGGRDYKPGSISYHPPLPMRISRESKPVWGKWTQWSPCSVTCGKGRHIRWKRCVQHCDGIETEMEEKTCQLPACGGTLFGLIHL